MNQAELIKILFKIFLLEQTDVFLLKLSMPVIMLPAKRENLKILYFVSIAMYKELLISCTP